MTWSLTEPYASVVSSELDPDDGTKSESIRLVRVLGSSLSHSNDQKALM